MGAVKSKKKEASDDLNPLFQPPETTTLNQINDRELVTNSINKKEKPSKQLSQLSRANKYDHAFENIYMIIFLKEIGNKFFGYGNFPSDIVFHIVSFLLHRSFVYEKDFDDNGILFWLGTFQKTAVYQHPLDIGLVKVNPPKFYCGTTKQAFSHEMPPAQNWLEKGVPNSWAEIEFLHHTIIPTAYTLRHGYPIKGHALRHWNFEGRNPNEEWEILLEHRDDTSIPGNDMNDTATFFLPFKKNMKQYSIFRIYQVAETADRSPYLMMAGFEIYGYLFG
jgi:hypothetical protein